MFCVKNSNNQDKGDKAGLIVPDFAYTCYFVYEGVPPGKRLWHQFLKRLIATCSTSLWKRSKHLYWIIY